MMKKLSLVLMLTLFSIATVLAQRTISGTVTDESSTPLIGATVLVKGTTTGSVTDLDGRYSINVPSGSEVLLFSYTGYASKEITLGASNVVDIKLSEEALGLDEVVVVGYGLKSERELTGSVTQLETDEITSVPVASVDQALQGSVPGLQVVSTSGQPGSAVSVRLRGIGSINASSSPLYVVDGVPINSGDLSRNTTTSNALANINPNDIESVTVLKDASATSIYGSRAANGVILITTKSGKSGKSQVSLNAEYGFTDVAFLDDSFKPMNTAQFYELTLEGLANGLGGEPSDWEQTFADNWGDPNIDTDWFDEATRTGQQQRYTLSTSGGNEKTTFYLSGGYEEIEGTSIGSEFNRISGNLKMTHSISDRLRVNGGLNVSNAQTIGPSAGGAFRNPILAAFFLLPVQPAYDENGDPEFDRAIFPNIYNPLSIVEFDEAKLNQLKGIGNVGLEYDIIDNLTFSSRLGIDYSNLEEFSYRNPFFGDARNSDGSSYSLYTRLFNWVWTNLVDYRWNIDDENILSFQVGAEAQESQTFGQTSGIEGLPPTTDLQYGIVGANPVDAASFTSGYSFSSYFASTTYSYKGRYNLSGSFRRDGSSRFGSENRYGNFWSVGASWNVTEEPWFDVAAVDFLKVRASYGENGNAGIGNFAALATYAYGTAYGNYNKVPGSAPSNIGNDELTWEVNKPFNIGFNMGLLDNRIDLSFDWYKRTTSNLLLNVPLSRTSGFSSQLANVGEMENTGIEIGLNITPVKTANFTWDIGFNIATNNNKITDLGGQEEYIDGSFLRKVGEDFQSMYFRQYAGVDPQDGAAMWYVDASQTETTKNYAEAERVIVGSATPDAFGGINTTIAYKGLSLTAQFNYTIGNKVRDTWARYTQSDGFGSFFNKTAYIYENRWQQPGDITDVPKYVYNNTSQSSESSTRYIYDGDYIRLRTATLAYEVPQSLLDATGLSRFSVFVRGTNLLTFVKDDRLSFDPDVALNGLSNLQVPVSRSVTMGANISF